MPEQKMTYQERVHKLALSIAKEEFPETFKERIVMTDADALFWQRDCEHSVYLCINEARRIVAAHAEAIREFVKNTYYAPDTIAVKKFTDKYLLNHGYIEPKTDQDAEK